MGTSRSAAGSRRTAALFFALVLAGCGLRTTLPGGVLASGDYRIELAHGGRTRSYLLHVPPQARDNAALPVVVVLHGAADDAARNRAWLGLDPYADREGFVVVYPDGTGPLPRHILTWNAGACCGTAQWRKVDDVGFVVAVLDDVAERTHVDPTRVYATGFSNGGMLAYRLAAEASERFAAIAPVAGTSTVTLDARVHPMPVMHVHSVDDLVVPYRGGTTRIGLLPIAVRHPAVEDVLDAWARHDGCPDEPVTDAVPAPADGDWNPEHTAARLVWHPCSSGAEVVLWRLAGPGHVWPGPPARFPRWLLGPGFVLGAPSGVIDVRAEMWRFFSRFSRPEAAARS
jgi:polyhydroxybutyrate depolymerase